VNARVAARFCVMLTAAAVLANCAAPARDKANGGASAHAREIVITTVPLLTKELATTYPFLKKDFATGGILAGKEVYEFMPSTVTVVEGDTLRLTFINPEDDAHSFVMKDLSVSIPAQSETHATYVAAKAGVYDFVCAIPAHLPMMRGQLVVLHQEGTAH
jgi:plastocyanin